MLFKLIPLSEYSLKYRDGLPILLKVGTNKFGRSVQAQGPVNIIKYPIDWVQLSGLHCEVEVEQVENDNYKVLVTDKSTNGSYINNQKLPKNRKVEMELGWILTLSIGDKRLDYQLADEEQTETPLKRKEQTKLANKVKQEFDGDPKRSKETIAPNIDNLRTTEINPAYMNDNLKTSVPNMGFVENGKATEQDLLQQLEKSNKELRNKIDYMRQEEHNFKDQVLKEIDQKTSRLDALEIDLQREKNLNKELDLKIINLENQSEMNNIIEKNQNIKNLEQQIQQQKQDADRNIHQLTVYQEQFNAKTEDLEKYKFQLQQKEEEIVYLDRKNLEKEKTISNIKQVLQIESQEKQAITNKNKQLEDQLEFYKHSNLGQKKLIENLQSELNQAKDQQIQECQSRQDLQNNNYRLQQDLLIHKKTIEDLQDRITEYSDRDKVFTFRRQKFSDQAEQIRQANRHFLTHLENFSGLLAESIDTGQGQGQRQGQGQGQVSNHSKPQSLNNPFASGENNLPYQAQTVNRSASYDQGSDQGDHYPQTNVMGLSASNPRLSNFQPTDFSDDRIPTASQLVQQSNFLKQQGKKLFPDLPSDHVQNSIDVEVARQTLNGYINTLDQLALNQNGGKQKSQSQGQQDDLNSHGKDQGSGNGVSRYNPYHGVKNGYGNIKGCDSNHANNSHKDKGYNLDINNNNNVNNIHNNSVYNDNDDNDNDDNDDKDINYFSTRYAADEDRLEDRKRQQQLQQQQQHQQQQQESLLSPHQQQWQIQQGQLVQGENILQKQPPFDLQYIQPKDEHPRSDHETLSQKQNHSQDIVPQTPRQQQGMSPFHQDPQQNDNQIQVEDQVQVDDQIQVDIQKYPTDVQFLDTRQDGNKGEGQQVNRAQSSNPNASSKKFKSFGQLQRVISGEAIGQNSTPHSPQQGRSRSVHEHDHSNNDMQAEYVGNRQNGNVAQEQLPGCKTNLQGMGKQKDGQVAHTQAQRDGSQSSQTWGNKKGPNHDCNVDVSQLDYHYLQDNNQSCNNSQVEQRNSQKCGQGGAIQNNQENSNNKPRGLGSDQLQYSPKNAQSGHTNQRELQGQQQYSFREGVKGGERRSSGGKTPHKSGALTKGEANSSPYNVAN